MLDGNDLARILYAVTQGEPARGHEVLAGVIEIDPELREALSAVIDSPMPAAEQAQTLGDRLQDHAADDNLVNECYRVAFYLGSHWEDLAANPLYSYFLANRSGLVLDKWPHYFPIYHRHLERFRGRPIRVLEIGVYRGGGLAMWQKYFGPAARIVGADIDPDAARAVAGRFEVELGDQSDPDFLRAVNEKHGPFDVIIDDGGHTMEQQIVTATTLFPLLAEGGVLVVEDCHTSYWPSFGGGFAEPDSFLTWARARVDDLHARHSGEVDRDSIWAQELDGMHFYDSIVVLDKALRFRSFNEISGSSSYIFTARFHEVLAAEAIAVRDAARTDVDRLRLDLATAEGEAGVKGIVDRLESERQATDDELRRTRAELSQLRGQFVETTEALDTRVAELVDANGRLLESWDQIRLMRSSLSWRLTAPLRAVRRLSRP
jgi:hypothetical protein